jgi:uncharacterized metal-binding protein
LTIALITCSGISNTGRLTTEAARTLMQRMPGRFVWMQIQQSSASLEDEVRDADEVVIIDGCTDCCAKKKIFSCIAPYRHIITTELGITKNGMADVQFHEIEKVIDAIMDDGGRPV